MLDWAPAAISGGLGGTITTDGALAAQSLSCATWDNFANFPSWGATPTGPGSYTQLSQVTVTTAFTVLGLLASLAAATAAAIGALAPAHGVHAEAVPRACAVAGLVFWPIAWGTYVAAWTTDAIAMPAAAAKYADVFGGGAASYYTACDLSYGFALAVIANGLCLVWLIDDRYFTRPLLADTTKDDAPAAAVPTVAATASESRSAAGVVAVTV